MAQPARSTTDLMDPIRAAVSEVGRRIVGQEVMLERLMVGLLTSGHILLEGVPGLAKTLAVRTLAEIISASFSRIQFTPDLLPADVLGTMVFDVKTQEFGVKKGPIFGNIILADEINRAPAKVQSALLEAMQERQVTIEGQSYPLEPPFLVIATQNPIELEGTYPLPEAQLDRFLMRIAVGYPGRQEEKEVLRRRRERRQEVAEVPGIVSHDALLAMQAALEEVYIDDAIDEYIVDLVRATRGDERVALGASPRGALALQAVVRAEAVLQGRDFVTPDDVKAMAVPVLAHRIILRPELWVARLSTVEVVNDVLRRVPTPKVEAS